MLLRIYDLLQAAWRFSGLWIRQYILLHRVLNPLLKPILAVHNPAFGPKDAKRLKYYAQLIPTLAMTSYALLADRKLTLRERLLLSKLAAATPLIDDCFENAENPVPRLKAMIEKPEAMTAQNLKEAVLLYLLADIARETSGKNKFITLAYRVLEAQRHSQRQQTAFLDREAIRQISFDKGGYSTLLYHALLEQPEVPGETEALYRLGAMVQWVDDLFDVYEDSREGIQTLVSTCTDIRVLRRDFETELINLRQCFEALPLPQKHIRRYWALMDAFFALAKVCLDQLERVQETHGGVFDPLQCSRKELVCDMALLRNQWKWGKRLFDRV